MTHNMKGDNNSQYEITGLGGAPPAPSNETQVTTSRVSGFYQTMQAVYRTVFFYLTDNCAFAFLGALF